MNLTEADAETLLDVIELMIEAAHSDREGHPDHYGMDTRNARKDAMKLLTAPEDE